jgi:hypothetical protein
VRDRDSETLRSPPPVGDGQRASAPGGPLAALAGRAEPAALLRLQATAGNRATGRVLARRELANSTTDEKALAATRNWTTADREKNTDRWKAACEENLLNLRNGEYTQIAERRDFYKWFYDATADKGFETRWALAAYIVAGGMAEMAAVDYSEGVAPITNELQGLARIGNQVIFDDVLPKLRSIYAGAPLKGADARKRDEQILAEEQELIQHLYTGVTVDAMERFKGMANMTYTRAQIGVWLGLGGKVAKGKYNVESKVPTFASLVPDGDITKPADRWKYGMALAAKLSTLPDYGKLDPLPSVGAAYTSGDRFKQLNVRPHLHRIDAMINDADIPEPEVIAELKALNHDEQRAFFADVWRGQRVGNALSFEEMKDAIGALEHMHVSNKMVLLGWALVRSWTSIAYSEVQPMIKLAAKHHPEDLVFLHTDQWKKVFLDICDDDTIVDAVRDMQLPDAMATAWVSEELSVF